MTEIAESLYKTSVDRIKVLEKQVGLLTDYLSFCTSRCPDDEPFKAGCNSYNECSLNNDCSACWQDWSLKEAERAVKDE